MGYDLRRRVMRERSTKDSTFPYWVAITSLVFVLVLFFSNTVPALRESQSLRDLQAQLVDLQLRHDKAIAETARQARLGIAHPGEDPDGLFDLQALLVAIDAHDSTPLELWQRYQGSLGERKEQERR